MKLITSSSILEKEFIRLLTTYREYYWMMAWASVAARAYDELLKKTGRIRKMVVGIHFYQTHPDFIESLLSVKNVRFLKQPAGTFHPKLYLFRNDDQNWELLIGSPNFTGLAFKQNTEATLLLESSDHEASGIYSKARNFVDAKWAEAEGFDKEELDRYRRVWRRHRPKIESLSGSYGGTGKKASAPIHTVPVLTMSWEEFVNRVKADRIHYPEDRLRVVETANRLFREHERFADMSREDRQKIAGTGDGYGEFGNMKGSGVFRAKVNENDRNISCALDQVPLYGAVTKANFDGFVGNFSKSFPSGGFIATGTRLLAMKRPDWFVCLNSKNRSRLCKAFNIAYSGMSYERYWNEIVERILDSVWWGTAVPRDSIDKRIYRARSAFLDALYFVW